MLADEGVVGATTVYDTNQRTLVSRDGRETLVIVSLAGDAARRSCATFRRIEPLLRAVAPPVEGAIGGLVALHGAGRSRSRARTPPRAEVIALPIAALLTLLFFRGVVAALLPIVIGAFALAAAAALVRIGAELHRDLDLRDERRRVPRARSVDRLRAADRAALPRGARATAADVARRRGRHARYRRPRRLGLGPHRHDESLGAAARCPLPVLRSVAIGGVLVIASALIGALLLLPALLAWLGPNVNRWPIGRARDERGAEPASGCASASLDAPSGARGASVCVAVLATLARPRSCA